MPESGLICRHPHATVRFESYHSLASANRISKFRSDYTGIRRSAWGAETLKRNIPLLGIARSVDQVSGFDRTKIGYACHRYSDS
jgi:hypothetical protein